MWGHNPPYPSSLPSLAPGGFLPQEKKNTEEMRQVVNHSKSQLHQQLRRWHDGEQAPSTKLDPLSYNERILAVKPVGPKMEMSKGADVAHNAFILMAYDLDIVLITYDAKGFFHCFKVSLKRCTEQGLITRYGLSVSCALDMGLTDAPENSGGMSDFIRMAVGLALDQILRTHPLVTNNPKACAYRKQREEQFGVGSEHTWWAATEQYSDDLTITTLQGLEGIVDTVVHGKGTVYNLQWHIEKYGLNAHIGYRYDFSRGIQGTQHINKSKLEAYAAFCDKVALMTFIPHKLVDRLLGEINHAASVETELKQHVGALNRARHVKTRLNKDITPNSEGIRYDLRCAAAIMRTDRGLPLLCEWRWPDAHAITTISLRSDACLNEGWNGFGAWFIVPRATGVIDIFAIFDEWSELEQLQLGHNTPAAEALGVSISAKVCDREGWAQPHHLDLLALSDSETTAMKFAAVKMGSRLMDTIRDDWLVGTANRRLATTCDHLPREFNASSRGAHTSPSPSLEPYSCKVKSHPSLRNLLQVRVHF